MEHDERAEAAVTHPTEDDLPRRDLVSLLGALAGASVLYGCAEAAEQTEQTGQGRSALFTIGGAIPKTPYTSLEDAVDNNQGGTPITVIIDKPIPIDRTSLVVPPHMTLRFQDGGQLVVPPGKTVTLSGPIEAPACPAHALFKVGGLGPDGGPSACVVADGGTGDCGKVVPNHSGTKYYANWWSDDSGRGSVADADIGQQWNNMARELVKNGPAVRARHFAVAGNRKLRTMMDIRKFQDAQYLDFSEARFEIDMPGGIAVNFTDSSGLYVRRLRLASTNLGPHVGVLLARSLDGSGLDCMIFDDLRIGGVFRIACLYNVASRGNVFVGGEIAYVMPADRLSRARYLGFFGRFVPPEDLGLLDNYPAYGPRPPVAPSAFGDGGARDQVLLATKFNSENVSEGTVYLRGFNDFSALSIYTNSNGPKQDDPITAPNGPHVVIDAQDNSMGSIAIEDLYGHGGSFLLSSQKPPGFLIKNGGIPQRRVGNVKFTTRSFATGDVGVRIEPRFVNGVYLDTGGGRIECHPDTWLREADIRALREVRVQLGDLFSGRIALDSVDYLTVPAGATVDAEVATVALHPVSPRYRHYAPLAIAARPSVPTPEADEAILWNDSVTGDLKATVSRCIGGELHTKVFTLKAFVQPP